jgi:hypothetical protein
LTTSSELHGEVTIPELAKELALCRAVSLAGDEGFDKIVVVSNYLSLVQRWQSPKLDRSIKLLQTRFSSLSIHHVRESAHILARLTEQFISSAFRNFIYARVHSENFL